MGRDREAVVHEVGVPTAERQYQTFKHASTQYDKPAENYHAALKLFSVRLWLRVYDATT